MKITHQIEATSFDAILGKPLIREIGELKRDRLILKGSRPNNKGTFEIVWVK